jgi:Domain of unknown function (DUF1905)
MRFRATLETNGKTATGIEVPASVVDELGSGKRPAVRVTLGPHTYRTTTPYPRYRSGGLSTPEVVPLWISPTAVDSRTVGRTPCGRACLAPATGGTTAA